MSALVLIDWPNLLLNLSIKPNDPKRFNLNQGFKKLIRWIEEATEIKMVFLFTPMGMISGHSELFHRLGFFVILCPTLPPSNSGQKLVDTTDDYMIKLGMKIVDQQTGLTHLCLVSGDADFIPLVEKSKERGLKIMITAGDIQSLSSNLSRQASPYPKSSKKMIHFFSPFV